MLFKVLLAERMSVIWGYNNYVHCITCLFLCLDAGRGFDFVEELLQECRSYAAFHTSFGQWLELWGLSCNGTLYFEVEKDWRHIFAFRHRKEIDIWEFYWYKTSCFFVYCYFCFLFLKLLNKICHTSKI